MSEYQPCLKCHDVGVVTAKTDAGWVQKVCEEAGCEGRRRVEYESQQIVDLLASIENYRTCLLAVGNNQTIVDRHRNAMFTQLEIYKRGLR